MHSSQEVAHADWSVEALAALETDPAVVRAAAQVAADAWWDFLSEREASRPPALAAEKSSALLRSPEGGGARIAHVKGPYLAAASTKARARSR